MRDVLSQCEVSARQLVQLSEGDKVEVGSGACTAFSTPGPGLGGSLMVNAQRGNPFRVAAEALRWTSQRLPRRRLSARTAAFPAGERGAGDPKSWT